MKTLAKPTTTKTTAELRRRIKKQVDSLPAHIIPPIAQIVDELESVEATRELLAIPGLLASHRRALKEFARGGGTPWREVRNDV